MGKGSGFHVGGFLQAVTVLLTILVALCGLGITATGIYYLVGYVMYQDAIDAYIIAIPIAVICFGAFVFISTISYVAGLFCGKGNCLFVAAVLIIIQMLVLVAFILFLFIPQIREKTIVPGIESVLNGSIANYGDPKHNVTTDVLDRIQSVGKCCGVANYTDWSRITLDTENSVPASCCLDDTTGCGDGVLLLTTPSAEEVIHVRGCVRAVVDILTDHQAISGGVSGGTIAVLTIYLILVFNKTFNCCSEK